MMKKVISAVLIAGLLLSCVLSAGAASKFTDLNDSAWDWARESIDAMTEQGLIAGYSENTFGPADGVTTLQAMLFMSRIIGFYEPINSQVLKQANALYGSFLSGYSLKNQNEIALLMYYGVFSESELKSYLAASKINQPLKRYEAAIFLTKTAGAEKTVSSAGNPSFADASEIPANARSYVAYVVKQGYMVGLSDAQFGGSQTVNRAQMAAMLYRVIKDLNISYISGEAVKTTSNSVSVSVSGASKAYEIPAGAEVRVNGVIRSLDQISIGDSVILKYMNGSIRYVDVFTADVDSTGEGYVSAKKTGAANALNVVLKDSSESKEFELTEDCKIFYESSEVKFDDILVGDNVTLSFQNGKICKVLIQKRSDTVTSVDFVRVVYEPEITLVVKTSAGAERTFLMADQVSVRKNSRGVDLKDLLPGDNLTLTLTKNKVSAISATSHGSSTSGTIEAILISAEPSITVNNGKTSSTFAVTNGTVITVDGKEGTIYDLKLGYAVDVSIESDTVTKITTKVVQTSNTLMGTVDSVNSSYGFLNIYASDAATGTTEKVQVFTKKNNGTKIIDNKNNGNTRALKNVVSGESVLITGVKQADGSFEASTIIILAD